LKKQYQAGDITKEQYDRMIKAIDSANAAEVTKSSRGFAQKASDAKFKGFTPKSHLLVAVMRGKNNG
jgi:rhamnose utilization protein RhaD (predicted bifunctional aldolase and dehydrogenase)